MATPKYNVGDVVTVQDKRYQATYEVGKKEPVSYVSKYKWTGVITHVRYDLNHFGPWLGTWNKPMLIKDYPIYYLVKQGNYHSTRVDEEKSFSGQDWPYISK